MVYSLLACSLAVLAQCQVMPSGETVCSPAISAPAFTVNTRPAAPVTVISRVAYKTRDGRWVDMQWDSTGKMTWKYRDIAVVAQAPQPKPTPVVPNPVTPKPPVAPVLPEIPKPALPIRNEGLDIAKVFNLKPSEVGTGRFRSVGEDAKKFQANVESVEAGVISADFINDNNKPFVTVFSEDKAKRDELKERLKKLLGNDAKINAFDPKISTVAEKKFWVGKDVILFQKPPDHSNHDRGPVVARLPLTATDQQIISSRRLADPDYDPSKDGDHGGGLGFDLDSINRTYVALAVAAVVVLYTLSQERVTAHA